MFNINVGSVDRTLRIVVGLVLLVVWYMSPDLSWRLVLLIVGLLALVTGLSSRCPAYSLLGINTCGLKGRT